MNIQSTVLATRTPRPTDTQASAPPKQECECDEKTPSLFARTADVVATGAKNTLNEGVLAAKNDPALAMRMAATTLSDTLLKKVDAPVQEGFKKTIVPVMRFALLGGNVYRAKRTFDNPHSSNLEKTIDAGVVVSDLIGAAGGIAMLTSSRFAGLGETLMGFSYAVDAVSHAYRGLNHANERIQYWSTKNQENAQETPPVKKEVPKVAEVQPFTIG